MPPSVCVCMLVIFRVRKMEVYRIASVSCCKITKQWFCPRAMSSINFYNCRDCSFALMPELKLSSCAEIYYLCLLASHLLTDSENLVLPTWIHVKIGLGAPLLFCPEGVLSYSGEDIIKFSWNCSLITWTKIAKKCFNHLHIY